MKKQVTTLLAGIFLCADIQVHGDTLDANFRETTFATVGSQVTGMTWAPDGSNRLFVTRKTGQIQIVKNGAVLPANFATVSPIFLDSECGLIGICLDPNFAVNGYVYLFVTVSSSEQQIIRYTAVGDIGTNKTVLIPGLPTLGQNHDGGSIGIGPDGKLYWGIGDNGSGIGVDADLTSLAAKIGRANLDGSIPSDNPFVDGPGGNNDYIWARGFRNPFTLTFQGQTGALWVNVVGTSYEQVFLVTRGDHAGYNDYENNQPAGYITPRIKYRTNGTDTRNIAASGAVRLNDVVTFTTTSTHGFRVGEQITIAGLSGFNGQVYVASVPNSTTFTAVQAGADTTSGGGTATTLSQGGCITGGAFYESTGAPADYRGNYFYGDLNSDRLMRARISSSNTVVTVDHLITSSQQQLDTAVGPDGAIYYVEHGGEIHRLAYTNFTSQQLVVTPTAVRMVEGGFYAANVRLATAPAVNVTVTVARSAGDATISVTNGPTLTFTPANWSVPQAVWLQAAADDNTNSSTATFTFSAPGVASESLDAFALDSAALPFTVGPVVRESGPGFGYARVYLTGEPGRRYALEGSTNAPEAWTSLATNQLTAAGTNFLDAAATNLPLRFYRARLVP